MAFPMLKGPLGPALDASDLGVGDQVLLDLLDLDRPVQVDVEPRLRRHPGAP